MATKWISHTNYLLTFRFTFSFFTCRAQISIRSLPKCWISLWTSQRYASESDMCWMSVRSLYLSSQCLGRTRELLFRLSIRIEYGWAQFEIWRYEQLCTWIIRMAELCGLNWLGWRAKRVHCHRQTINHKFKELKVLMLHSIFQYVVRRTQPQIEIVCQFIHFSSFSSRRTSGQCAVWFRYFENSVQSRKTMEFVVVDPSIWSTLLLFLLSIGSAALCTETSIKNFISLAHSRRVLVYWNRCVSVVRTLSPSSIYLPVCERRKQK